ISDRQLRSVAFAGGALQAGGASYRAIILPETRFIPHETFELMVTLASEGATIVARAGLPSDTPGLGDLDRRRASLKSLVGRLGFGKMDDSDAQVAKIGKGRFLLGNDLKRLLALAGIKPETMTGRGLRFIRRKDGGGRYYFVVNQGDRAMDG